MIEDLFWFANNEDEGEIESRYYIDEPASSEQVELFTFEED